MKKRDYIDSTREESPLRQADDALVLDNSHMTLDEQKAWLLGQYHKADRFINECLEFPIKKLLSLRMKTIVSLLGNKSFS